jgi:hypothetical protein
MPGARSWTRLAKQQVGANGRQQENAVIQMMNVRSAKVHVRNPARHDEEHQDTCSNERKEK